MLIRLFSFLLIFFLHQELMGQSKRSIKLFQEAKDNYNIGEFENAIEIYNKILKSEPNNCNAIILSYAGIKSLKMENNISEVFSLSEIIPSAGQGAIALQCRKGDNRMVELLKALNHIPTNICVNAERDVLKVLDGDCETPVGVNAKIQNDKLNIVTELFSLDGKKRFYLKSSKKLNLAHLVGNELGEKIKKKSKNLYKKKG